MDKQNLISTNFFHPFFIQTFHLDQLDLDYIIFALFLVPPSLDRKPPRLRQAGFVDTFARQPCVADFAVLQGTDLVAADQELGLRSVKGLAVPTNAWINYIPPAAR